MAVFSFLVVGRIIRTTFQDIKKTLNETMGRSLLSFDQVEQVVMDKERHMNNRPLTFVESEDSDHEVLAPNIIMWRENINILGVEETEEKQITKFDQATVEINEIETA